MADDTFNPTPTVQQTFDQIERELGAGMVPRIFRLLEAKPAILAHLWGQFRAVILQGNLPRTLKEMVGMVVAISTHCDYVQVIHMHSLTLQGVATEALKALHDSNYSSEQLSSQTQKVLRWAALTVSNRTAYADDRDWQTLRHQTAQALTDIGLGNEETIEVLATVALFEQICTVANLLQLDPTQP